MVNLFPILKQQEHPIFERFNALYWDILAENCPPLQEFQIAIPAKCEESLYILRHTTCPIVIIFG